MRKEFGHGQALASIKPVQTQVKLRMLAANGAFPVTERAGFPAW